MFPKSPFRIAASKQEEMGLHATLRQVIASKPATKGWSGTRRLPSLTWVGGELERTKPALPSSGGETLLLASTSSPAKTVGTLEGFVPPRGGTCPSRSSFYTVTGVYIKCCQLESILKRFLPALH